ncbi:MAG: bifunctional diaminohydroxyphosphoribosylaminopyrimidine deaminase/5-amino-6-(5-phosphoribosylamino)uracil reductase RibD [FCB group bacterium]|jgi:diaminohydroxyphosphoribosylaminopyrimidine deaminase/5-amino-6-(5-phosphoribosylamino)uracil reductase|nr:bifunctional diaminohydroxyphosphoribosylaminopyrimidine deaminase/5-amino-6-(5-phosphoribosylamino)uracil reductase RibD [FCB group bacterium]
MTDEQYMQRALDLAEQGRGRTSPNPMVGCVVVRDGRIIGEGWHQKAGEAHAEVNAVEQAGDITGATLYVTLEPCCHQGRTPPCLDLLLKHRPARVVVAMHDPNPKVSGESIFRLRDAGIAVDVGVGEEPARLMNEAFIKYITTRTPFVIAKVGMTLDGKIATRTGDSRWVTGEAARRRVHELRNEVDAILVGSRTVMTDDPSLTTRLDDGDTKDPIRIILDADDYLDPNARVFHTESKAPTWVVLPEGRDFQGADQVIRIRKTKRGVDMIDLMHELAKREVMTILIEGGGTTHATAFKSGVVDKIMFFVAPKIIGGRDAVTAVEGEGGEKMDDAILLDRMTARPVGEDLLIEAYVKKEI